MHSIIAYYSNAFSHRPRTIRNQKSFCEEKKLLLNKLDDIDEMKQIIAWLFSKIRFGVTLFGMITMSLCTNHLSMT